MKRFNYFVMSLISAAAFTFTACSSSDDLNGGGAGESKVDGFYMTLSVQAPTNGGSRTAENNPVEATTDESDVTSGTFYLVDANGNVAFTKTISAQEWADSKIPTQGQTGKSQLKIEVEKVAAGATYKVYFLANTTDASPWSSVVSAGTSPFVGNYADATKFAMFNQNDPNWDGNKYTVIFTDDNKDINNPASVTRDGVESPIKIERITARIDQPSAASTTLNPVYSGSDVTDAEKRAMEDAVNKVQSISLTGYAIANLPNQTYLMQHWTGSTLAIPTAGLSYFQEADDLGTETYFAKPNFFKAITATSSNKDYVFENNSAEKATTMYFEYTVTLKDMTGADFTDGTFYRYNNIIFKSFKDIIEYYKDVVGLFKGKTAEELVTALSEAKNDADPQAKLAAFRAEYDIEVFNEGKTYYKKALEDQFLGAKNVIQRNSIYQVNVMNIFNIGAQVPNGEPDTKGMFYLDVEVSVNPWVLNVQNVDLK